MRRTGLQEGKGLRAFIGSRRGTSVILGALVLIVVVFVSGFSFVNFVMSNVEFAKTVFNTQMKNLLLDSFSANITHIVVYLKNTGKQTVEITQAYVNSMLTMLQDGKAIIQPLSIGVATIVGLFAEGNTYTIKLSNIFNTAVTFTVTI